MRSKVSVIGAGNVGATLAHILAHKGFIDVVMMDIIEGYAPGQGPGHVTDWPYHRLRCQGFRYQFL